jgi:hypothetical protein
MDVGKSFTYMFEDKEWIAKIAIGGIVVLLSVFIIPIPLLIGYALAVIKRVYEGDPMPLPEWSNIGDMYVKGLTAIVGVLIWASPVILLACCSALLIIAFGAGTDGNSGNMNSMAGILLTCVNCVIILVSLAINLFVYAPLTNFALTNQINTFWDFRGAWNFIKANTGNYIIAFLLALVANFIAGFGTILCFVGVFFTSFWALLVMSHLFGQVARSNMTPTDSGYLPPAPPPAEPPSMMQGPYEPAPSA